MFRRSAVSFVAIVHNVGMPRLAKPCYNKIGLSALHSYQCRSCKLYRPAKLWKNIIHCTYKDVKLVIYNLI